MGIAGCGDGPLGALEASGFIEADEVSIVAETSGRVAEILTREGEAVEAGQVLVRLDESLLQSQRAEALAAVEAARALRDEEINGPRPEELAQAEARLAAAQAELDGSRLSMEQAQESVENPREIYTQFASVNAQVQAAAEEVELADAKVDEATFWIEALPRDDDRIDVDQNELQLRQHREATAQAELEAAKAKLAGLEWQAGLLAQMTELPLGLMAQMHQAEARYEMAQATLQSANAEVDTLEAGPTGAERDLLDAQVRLAESQLMLVDALIDQLALAAPFDGVVTSRATQVGETALPNVPLMTVADLEDLQLVVYIPEDQIGRVQPGQTVEIRVDAYPLRAFEGEVQSIAREAEFTPRNVQTEEERVNLVFAVEIDIPNPEGLLKPGMPADATIKT